MMTKLEEKDKVVVCSRCLFCILLFMSVHEIGCVPVGMLFPQESESRQINELDGFWNFRADDSSNRRAGLDEKWYNKRLADTGPVIIMPVSSSFNDITTDKSLQNFVGWVWYDREFFVSSDWSNKRIVFRVESAHYNAVAWINGQEVVSHEGGHLPFAAQVNHVISFSKMNRVTIAVNNTLGPHTLPPGTLTFHTDDPGYPPGYFVQNLQFDFFNYAGIHRKVRLYTTPMNYIDDITITTDIVGTSAVVSYDVVTKDVTKRSSENFLFFESVADIEVQVLDRNETIVAQATGASGHLSISNAHLWWPYTMNATHFGYMYTLRVAFGSDVYRQRFGVRTVAATDTQLLINKLPFYCHGVAKHEDSDIRGKGLDFPLIARDFNMLKWLGANCFRTSHYPYAEEILDEADRQGIVVIDECPGVGIKTDENFGNKSLQHHLEVMEELVQRDKNRPAVIIWSVANEPSSDKTISHHYFKAVIDHTKQLDKTRLVTFVMASEPESEKAGQYCDILCVNRYYGWYADTGHIETIHYKLTSDLQEWYKRFKKPIIITEYGADTVAGLHMVPSFVFTEDFQTEFMREYHLVFDAFRKSYLVGEMVWNFADFMTTQTTSRVVGNRKGVLTRQRQPKESGHLLRLRYWSIINETISNHSTFKK